MRSGKKKQKQKQKHLIPFLKVLGFFLKRNLYSKTES